MSPPAPPLSPRLALLQEQRYRRRFLRDDSRQTAICMSVAAFAYGLGVVNDLSMFPRGALVLYVSVASRALLAAVAVFALVVQYRVRGVKAQDRAFRLAHAGTAVAFLVNFTTRLPHGPVIGNLLATGTLLVLLYFGERGELLPRAIVAGATT